MNPLKYIFYKIYTWSLKANGKSDLPHYNTIIGISFLMGINLLTISIILSIVSRIKLVTSSPTILLGGISSILVFNYFYFIYDNKYLKIIKHYRNIDDRLKIKGALATVCYIVFTFVFFCLSVYILYIMNND